MRATLAEPGEKTGTSSSREAMALVHVPREKRIRKMFCPLLSLSEVMEIIQILTRQMTVRPEYRNVVEEVAVL